jgi:glycine cleavage system aminomethyltransferase T
VRKPGNGRYVGVEALDAQRAACEAIAAGSTDPVHRHTLPQWVQPLAVFAGRRPLRAGYELFLDDEPVGYVTSGSSVPVAGAEGERATRPIGLALVRSGLDHRSANQALDVRDTRATLMQAHLVAANLPPPAAPEESA